MMRQRAKFCKLISRHAENALSGKLGAVARRIQYRMQNGSAREVREIVSARMQGDYFRRNRFEISPEIERNTSTASAPIMQKAIIMFSGRAQLRY
jgi:hypothetical protein